MRRLMRRRSLLVLLLLLFVPVAGAWTWPVQGPVLQTFSFDPAHPYAAGQQRGIAIGGGDGAPVLAPASGIVSFAGTVPTNGKTLTIQTPSGLAVSLTHLGSIVVARNASVDEGAAVGTVGPSGTPEFDVSYVHLGIREAANDQGYLDPLAFLPVLAPPAACRRLHRRWTCLPRRRLSPRPSRSRRPRRRSCLRCPSSRRPRCRPLPPPTRLQRSPFLRCPPLRHRRLRPTSSFRCRPLSWSPHPFTRYPRQRRLPVTAGRWLIWRSSAPVRRARGRRVYRHGMQDVRLLRHSPPTHVQCGRRLCGQEATQE